MTESAAENMNPLLSGEQPLPNSREAEQAVLSCLLSDAASTADLTFALLQSEAAFFHPPHRTLFGCLREMRADGSASAIDLITVTDRLSRKGVLDDIGGDAYLAQLLNMVPTTANLERYLQIVQQTYVLRQLIATSTDVIRRCYECDGNVPELVDAVEAEIMGVAEMRADEEARHLRELMPGAIEYLDDLFNRRPGSLGMPTGFDIDDKISGLRPGELIILAARPSIGKTTLAMNIARNVAINGNGVAFFSLEMGSQQVVVRLLSSESRINLKDIRDGRLTTAQWASEIVSAGDRLQKVPLYIDDTPQLSSLEIRQKARRLKQKYDIKLIVVDYLQLMRAVGGNRTTNREQEVAKQSADMKALAKELNVPIVLLAQLNRQAEQGGRPKLSQLRESGAIEQDADVVMLLHRARETDMEEHEASEAHLGIESEVIIAKNRNGETGIVKMTFLPYCTRFEDASRMSEEDVSRIRT